MLYPIHMISPGFGDVLLKERQSTGIVIIKNASPYPLPGYIPNTTIKFDNGGSGFLVSNYRGVRVGMNYVLGLILTAAHVVYSVKTYRPKASAFKVYYENGSAGKAYFLKDYINDFPQEMFSVAAKQAYCLPGDVAVLVLISDTLEHLGFYELNNQFRVDSDCFVPGYPLRPENIKYCFPQGQNDSDLENIVNVAFNGFSGLVHSSGKVLSFNDCLIDITCSTTNGMAGAPVVLDSKAIGVYVGGPPVIGQRKLFKMMQQIRNNEIENVYQEKDSLLMLDNEFRGGIFENIVTSYNFNHCYSESQIPGSLVYNYYKECLVNLISEGIYNCVIMHVNPDIFISNTAISAGHQLFEEVQEIIVKLNHPVSLQWSKMDELLNYLRT